jgi:hypothetical protein
MTTTTKPPTSRGADRRKVYGEHGEPIATVSSARVNYLGTLLSQCEFDHIYVLPESVDDWDRGCPRCRVLGLAPGDSARNHDGD